jgi:hypothetical protein
MLTNFVNTYKRKLMIGNIGDSVGVVESKIGKNLEDQRDAELALTID